jgi:hypothetical protein
MILAHLAFHLLQPFPPKGLTAETPALPQLHQSSRINLLQPPPFHSTFERGNTIVSAV